MADKAFLERLTRELTDRGLLIEAGWVGFRVAAGWENISKAQLDDCHKTFFAGALHLFSSIMTFLDEGEEPTDDDMRRMDLISEELRIFGEKLKRGIYDA